jgi:glycosyltransferase involved in cell wall biosynthesis
MKSETPLISVIITCFNYGRFIAEALSSVRAQTLQDLEIIVVEGGSTDGQTPQEVAALAGSGVRVMAQPVPTRVGANRNLGIRHARGRYIVCLDADDLLRPTYLEKAVYLLERRGADIVSSGLEMFGAETGLVPIMARPDLATLMGANHVLTCAVIRREFWERAGGFRDNIGGEEGHVHEDWAFWVRAAALGARVVNMSHDFLLHYRVHAASLSRRGDVLPMARQQAHVRAANSDVITPHAIAASRAALEWRPAHPPLPDPAQASRPALLIALPWLVLGGAERLLAAVVHHLVAHGWDITIVTTLAPGAEAGDSTAWFTAHTARVFHLPVFLDEADWADFILAQVTSRGVATLMLAGSSFTYGLLRRLRACFPSLRIVDLLFNTVGHTENNRRYRRLIDLTIVENAEVRDWLLERGEVSERIQLIQSGIDLEAAHPRLRNAAGRKSLGLPAKGLVVGFVGRWSEEKNPLAFLALAAACADLTSFAFVMTGTGKLRAEVERQMEVEALKLQRFKLLGLVEDPVAVIANLDLLVIPSLLDGRPIVALESIGTGTPILASAVGGLPELVRPEVSGWLVEPGNVSAMEAVLRQLAMAPELLASMRPKVRAFALVEADYTRMASAFANALMRQCTP